jgi:hypothetical protein
VNLLLLVRCDRGRTQNGKERSNVHGSVHGRGIRTGRGSVSYPVFFLGNKRQRWDAGIKAVRWFQTAWSHRSSHETGTGKPRTDICASSTERAKTRERKSSTISTDICAAVLYVSCSPNYSLHSQISVHTDFSRQSIKWSKNTLRTCISSL